MADVTPLIAAGSQVIQAYSPNGFRVSGRDYSGAIIVTAERVVPWTANFVSDLKIEDFSGLGGDIDVLLLGCGARMALPPTLVKAGLRARGIALEPMDTGAACRTYNVLMAEGRRVAAALLKII